MIHSLLNNSPAWALVLASIFMLIVLGRLAAERVISKAVPVGLVLLHIAFGLVVAGVTSCDHAGRPNTFLIPPFGLSDDQGKQLVQAEVLSHGKPPTSALDAIEMPSSLVTLVTSRPGLRDLEFKGAQGDSVLWTIVPRDDSPAIMRSFGHADIHTYPIIDGKLGAQVDSSKLDHIAFDAPVHLNGIELTGSQCWLMLYDGRLAKVELSAVAQEPGDVPNLVHFNAVAALDSIVLNRGLPLVRGWQGLSIVPALSWGEISHALPWEHLAPAQTDDIIFLSANSFAHVVAAVAIRTNVTGSEFGPARLLGECALKPKGPLLRWDEGCCYVDNTWNGAPGVLTTEARSGLISITQTTRNCDSISSSGAYIEGCAQRGHTLFAIDRTGLLHQWNAAWTPRAKPAIDLSRFCEHHAQDLAFANTGDVWIAWETSFRKIPQYQLNPLFLWLRWLVEKHLQVLSLLLLVEAVVTFRESGRGHNR